MSAAELHDQTVAELGAGLRAKRFSALELARHFLERGQRHTGLGAFLARDEQATRARSASLSPLP